MTPVPGSIGVEHGTSWESLVIQWGTRSRYNHVVVCERVESADVVTVIEAAGGGVRRRSIAADREVWDNFALTPRQRQQIVAAAQRCLGIPYAWYHIAGFVFRHGGDPKPKVGWAEPKPEPRVICSELASWCLRQVLPSPGVDILPGVPSADISPGDVADFMFRHPGLVLPS